MKPAAFDYIRPESLDEVVEALSNVEDPKILAGGQSLVPMLNMRLARPGSVIALRGVPGLDNIHREVDSIRVDAMVSQERFRRAMSGYLGFEALSVGMEHIGHPQTRSTGTVCGSIAHADPSAELPMLLHVYRGSLNVLGPAGIRVIEARDFFLFPYTTTLDPQEVLVSARWPMPLDGTGSSFREFARRRGDFALVAVACQLQMDQNQRLVDGVLGVAGVAGTPIAVDLPKDLKGWALSNEAIDDWLQTLEPLLDPPDDLEASSALRRRLVRTLGRESLIEAEHRARGDR